MAKKFTLKDKKLHVVITANDTIFIPGEKGEQVDVGVYNQVTTQVIEAEHIKTLKAFVDGEYDKANGQLVALKKQYEPIKDLKDLDEKIVNATKKAFQKGTKAFKDKAIALSEHIDNMNKKAQLKQQIEYMEKALVEIKADVDNLNKIIK